MATQSSPRRIHRYQWTIDRALGAVVAVFCVALLVELRKEGLTIWNNQGPGPGFVPLVLGIALTGLSLTLVIRPGDPAPTSTLAKLTTNTTDRSPVETVNASPTATVGSRNEDSHAEPLTEEEGEVESNEPVPFSRTLKYLLLVGLMVAFYARVGALLSMCLFVVIEMLWVEHSRWWVAVATAVGITAVVYLVFVRLLSVPLPNGALYLNVG
jgi:putative tricarboxylic transport membrane protein